MKILYVVTRPIEINTSASIRNHATISGLIENGHQVTIVSTQPDKNHVAYDDTLNLFKIEKKYFELGGAQSVIKIGRRIDFLNRIKPFLYKILYRNEMYDNLKGIIKFVNEIDIKNYDLVISSSDPKSSHLFVDYLFRKQKKELTWIQIWGDPFADDITRTNKKNIDIEQEENRLLTLADKIIYVSDLTCKKQKEKYPANKDKMFYVPIPYYKPRISDKEFPQKYKDIKLCYCGDYGSNIRNIVPIYEATKDLGLDMKICGMSDLNLKGDDKITVLPRQNADTVKKIENESDILIHLSNKKGTQIPGKIYQYISTNKVILFILDGDNEKLRETFEKYNRVIFVDNEKEKIKLVLKNICKLRKEVSNEPVEYFGAKNIASIIIEESGAKQNERLY